MKYPKCPRCDHENTVKGGVINNRQRYKCKNCNYFFTVSKLGKRIDNYLVVKALQLYIEGVSYREIERLLGVSHVSVMNWVKKYKVKAPANSEYRPTYSILTHKELYEKVAQEDFLSGSGMLLTELGDKYMMIKWERFRD